MRMYWNGKSLQERFDLQYTPEPNSGCWLWTGNARGTGYGVLKHQGKWLFAHRASLILQGIDPNGKVVMHTCDTPFCVNPNHLLLGTQRENILDASKKQRMCHGEKHPSSKLNEDSVRAIRASQETYTYLTRAYGVTFSVVQKVKTRKTWKHVI